jgi:hypothetical protein
VPARSFTRSRTVEVLSSLSDSSRHIETFLLRGYRGAPTRGTATIQQFDKPQRTRWAFTALGKWWGVALLCVFIPVAHFLLVPSFGVFGAWQFFQRLRTEQRVVDARGTCPDCGTEQQLELDSRWRPEQSVRCSHCQRALQLSTVPED